MGYDQYEVTITIYNDDGSVFKQDSSDLSDAQEFDSDADAMRAWEAEADNLGDTPAEFAGKRYEITLKNTTTNTTLDTKKGVC